MPSYVVRGLCPANTKATSAEFKAFKAAGSKTAKGMEAEIKYRIQPDGSINLEINKKEVADQIRTELSKIKGVTMIEVSNPMAAFVQGLVESGKVTLAS